MTALRLLVAYDGTDFSGFQVQPGERTVQGVLEDALAQLSGRRVRVRGAGRTDAGVHALGQVVSFDRGRCAPRAPRASDELRSFEDDELHPDVVRRAMAGILPSDVAVVDAQGGPEGFDARRSARRRTYVYLLWCGDAPQPLYRRYSLWARRKIDTCRLSEALAEVVGTHDFSSFARVREEQSPVRTVIDASCVPDLPMVRISIVAESFLHQMVRSIVGTAIAASEERKPAAWMRDVLAGRDRAAAGAVAPAHGLTLTDVAYDDAPWPNRAPVAWPWSDVTGPLAECAGGWA